MPVPNINLIVREFRKLLRTNDFDITRLHVVWDAPRTAFEFKLDIKVTDEQESEYLRKIIEDEVGINKSLAS